MEIAQLDTVVISGGGKGDRPVGSPGVNVSVGPALPWSDPPGRQATRQAVAQANRFSLENSPHAKRIVGLLGVPSLLGKGEGQRRRQWNWACDSRRTLRGRRGLHVGKEQTVKARNHSRVAEALPHSEGVAYKPHRGEVVTCLRVGRMGSIK